MRGLKGKRRVFRDKGDGEGNSSGRRMGRWSNGGERKDHSSVSGLSNWEKAGAMSAGRKCWWIVVWVGVGSVGHPPFSLGDALPSQI